MTEPSLNNPNPWGPEIYNLGKTFLGHHYYIHVLSLSELCSAVENSIFKEIGIFTSRPMWPHSDTRTPGPGVMKYASSGFRHVGTLS